MFSTRLAPLGFDIHSALVVDLMHEIELGVWKNVFIHLLRMLEATDKALTHELDRQYFHSSQVDHIYAHCLLSLSASDRCLLLALIPSGNSPATCQK